MKVSIVIPCYNEKATIKKIVEAVRAAPIQNKEIIIVDDGSRDGTQTLLNEISNTIDQVIYHPANRGKGAELRSGFAAATGDIILVQDADLEYSPDDYPALLEPLLSGKADAVLLAFYGRATAQGPFFLAHGWQSVFDATLQHVH